ncbi:uncharacterized protein LOC118261739 isoform X3 [Spodoptera frugiperda]|uniref:Uncharacterized protein LOC118261739 isoform X3 n=1 Tax=Spodoptera frugiperda TaxID=7108 RepID=A0A9R0CTD3_SPOFR|nr:uncharacterized protein LOC118261739 isoform X3 [Spodoptera frugiperda]
MSRNIVFEGWLTKSPPNRRIWRTRWRRRWFALRQSGELPGQYFLDYYADRNCRRLKGTIDLDLCEQVDAGLHMERHGQAPFNPSIRGSVFTIQTQRRTYHLEADCEAEMEKWVDAICRVCGLRATLDVPAGASRHNNVIDPSSVHTTNMSDNSECPDGTGPYIPISECITGVRAQDEQRHFTFEERNIIVNTRGDGHQYTSHPQIRVNAELSENDSNLSEDDDGSLHASHQNLPDWSVTKTFTKLSLAPKKNGPEEGPPVPPRPPKTFAGRSRDTLTKDPFQGPKIQEPTEVVQEPPQHSHQRLRVPRRMSQGAPSSPRSLLNARCPEEEEDFSPSQSALQYCNLPSLPPAVDRALKPRHSSVSIGQYNAFMAQEDGLLNEVHCYETIKPYRPSIRRSNFLVGLKKLFVSFWSLFSFRPRAPRLPDPLPKPPSTIESIVLPDDPPPSGTTTLGDTRRYFKRSVRLGRLSSKVDALEIPPANFLEIKVPSRSVGIITIPTNLLSNIVVVPRETGTLRIGNVDDIKQDALQYLDLDLHPAKPAQTTEKTEPRKRAEIAHGRSMTTVDTDAYKTVDFLKTEAFNITRQDAEASRSFQY